MPTEQDVLDALAQIQDPDLHRDIVSLGFIKNLTIADGAVTFDINLTTPACPVKDQIRADAERVVGALSGVKRVQARMTAEVRRTVDLNKEGVAGIRNFIAVASGKGGVGKSTVAVNLAVAVAQTGAKVGLLDADIYGPSIPFMMPKEARIDVAGDNTVRPAQGHGIKFISMGFMAPGDKPLIWRGPMAHHALQQCLFQTQWGELDYLFIDMPPGTGDVHLTIAQSIQVTGAVLVSTPQDVGLTISLKTYQMFKTTNVPILGIIENMSYYLCPHCGQRDDILGHGGAEEAANRLNIPFLGRIPIDRVIREDADHRNPIVLNCRSSVSTTYKEIAGKLAQQVSIASFVPPKLKIIEEKV